MTLEGDAAHTVGARDIVFVPRASGYRLTVPQHVRFLQIFAGVSSPDELEQAQRRTDGSTISVTAIDDVAGMDANDDAMGIYNVVSKPLVMAGIVESQNLLVGHTQFRANGGLHKLHKIEVDEFVYLLGHRDGTVGRRRTRGVRRNTAAHSSRHVVWPSRVR